MCLATLPLPDQRAKHLYAGDTLTLIIKKLELKNKNLSVQ